MLKIITTASRFLILFHYFQVFELKILHNFIQNSFKAIIDEQHRTFDPQNERHFLDICFKKIEETKDDPKSTHNC